MDETTLRALVDSLNQQLSALEWWLHTWTAIVILGCAGEAISVIREYREDKEDWFIARLKAAVSLPHKPSLKWLIFDLLSVALVVVGIAGELSVDFQSGDVQTKLRDANARLVLLFEKEAGDAKQSALIAAKAAKDAQVVASGAKTTADAANTAAGDASRSAGRALGKSQSADNSASAALSNANAIKTDLAALAKQEKSLEDRTTYQQKLVLEQMQSNFAQLSEWLRGSGIRVLKPEKLAKQLQKYSTPKRTVAILYQPDDSEVKLFSDAIYKGLKLARWEVSMRAFKPDEKLCGETLSKQELTTLLSKDSTSLGNTRDDNLQMALGWAAELGFSTQARACSEASEAQIIIVVPLRKSE